jgi:integrase
LVRERPRVQISLAAPSYPPENVHFLSFKAFCTALLVHQSGTLSMVLRMAQPTKRGGIYWLRKKVPDDLRPILKKREEKISLRTRDPAEAKILFAKALAEIEERWGRLRQGIRSLSHKECVAMAGEIYRRMVAEQEDNPSGDVFELLLDQHANGTAKVVSLGSNKEATAKAIERVMERRKARISERIDKFLVEEGHRIDAPSRSALQKHAEQAILKARSKTFKMSQGDYSPDPAAAAFPAYEPPQKVAAASVASREPTLTTAIAGWVKEKTRKNGDWVDSSARSNELWATRFKELVGDKPLKECTKADARAFKEAIMSLPPHYTTVEGFEGLSFTKAVDRAKTVEVERMSDRNVNKILGFVRAFWNWAEGQFDDVPGNPFNRMNLRVKTKARDERLPFSSKQLQAIFDAPLFTGCQSPKSWLKAGGHIPADQGIYWVPLIGLFTGARSGEIIQLLVDDIKEEGGVLYFNITDDGEEQNVKTDTSIRTIPVHPMLKKLGFAKFVAAQRKKGARLFPDFPKAADGYYSTAYSPRFNRFLKDIGVKTPKHSFHSFRHSFEDGCKNSRIPLEFINALQGHSDGGMAARYGDGVVRLRLLNEEMEKLHYEGLDFTRMSTARKEGV